VNAIVNPSKLSGIVNAIPSKSFAHRALICNFLGGNKGKIQGLYPSVDINATKNCIDAMTSDEKVKILDCEESGSTLRFLLSVAGAVGGEFVFLGKGKLMERPIEELSSVLSNHGVSIEKTDKIFLKGKLTSGKYAIRGDISSQYITGLLMALPILDGDSEIVLTTPLASTPYVDITLSVLNEYGVKIEKTENGFFIKGNQKYLSIDYTVEGDWSNAGYFLVASAINGDVKVGGLNEKSVQGDKEILSVIEKAGLKVEYDGDYYFVKKGEIKPFKFSAKECPDIVPATAVLGAFANGISEITDIARLKIKESDRVKSIITMLNSFGIFAEEKDDALYIHGGTIKSGKVDSFNDHRIVMASAILSAYARETSEINSAEAVNKSYPTFFEDFEKLNGEVLLYD
jgi:3-phosphoshikimate 1-carboxyvinyltransferase